ncbi:hypothetical protein TNCV_3015781 [Trichonephila clavipes]|nr:hypothetical protein TNCV_3015781 [Trichonephila clavipes]
MQIHRLVPRSKPQPQVQKAGDKPTTPPSRSPGPQEVLRPWTFGQNPLRRMTKENRFNHSALGVTQGRGRASKPNRHSRDLLHAAKSDDMAPVGFLHHENLPTWDGIEPATFSAESQGQTNHTPQKKPSSL